MSLAIFANIRDRVDLAFRKANYDHARFPEIAEAALLEASVNKNYRFDFDELTRWIMVPNRMAPMESGRLFSDLPIAIARGDGFFVEILVWAHATAAIHQHSFSGAFTVAQGATIHSLFEIETLERVSEALQIVRTRLQNVEMLKAGDVRRIVPAAQMTHSVFHLDEPTISIVVRTNSEPWTGPQLTILPPHYAYAPTMMQRDGQVDYLTRAFHVMDRISDPTFIEVAARRFAELDSARALALLFETIDLFVGPNLEAIVRRFKEAHGRVGDRIEDVVKRIQYGRKLRAIRQITADESERFALAAMLVSQSKTQARRILSTHPRGETLITGSEIPAVPKLWAELDD